MWNTVILKSYWEKICLQGVEEITILQGIRCNFTVLNALIKHEVQRPLLDSLLNYYSIITNKH